MNANELSLLIRPCWAIAFLVLAAGEGALAAASETEVSLPILTIYSQRVANQVPVATFAMPVSTLRFEPRVDVQARNFAEGQADVAIRGGIFENTGFGVGPLSLFDPQTGHYIAEIPIAPAMLGAPEIVTGADLGLRATNATTGAVVQGWRPVRTAGAAMVGAGEYGLNQAEVYQGYATDTRSGAPRLGADVAWAHSEADGSIAYGDHVFDRVNARIQVAGTSSQTDLFAGYQAKFFGWPNLYTPFNRNETEDLEMLLLVLNHRQELGAGDFIEAGIAYRRNKDDYVFDRLVGPVAPYFRHTTWVRNGAVNGRHSWNDMALNYRAEVLADELESTSLKFGRFHTRQLYKMSLVPEWRRELLNGSRLVVKAGASYDDSNRDAGAVAPVVELARESTGVLQRVYVSYAKNTQVPTYTALNSSASSGLFRGNPDLGRETSHNFETGVRGTIAGWTGQAAVFHRRDDDLVDWTFRQGVTARTANAVDVRTTGIEIVARRSVSRYDLVLGWTWLSKDSDYRSALVDASFYALNYARQRVTVALTARLTREFELRLDNEVRVQAPNALRTRGGEHPVISAFGLTYRPVAWRRLALSVQIDNLWNSDFQEVPAVPAGRRQTSFSIAYSW